MFGQGEGGGGESGRVQLPVCLRDRYTQLHMSYLGKVCLVREKWGGGESGRVQLPVCLHDIYSTHSYICVIFGKGMFGQGGRVAGCSSQYVFVTDTHSHICHIWERYVWSGRGGEGEYSIPVVGLEGNNDFNLNFIFNFQVCT
jgi:hypothetical protein